MPTRLAFPAALACAAALASPVGMDPQAPAPLVTGAEVPALESVRQAELAFARQADAEGIRPAFLAWLAEEARVFTPRMTRGWLHYGKEPGDPGHLAWYPEAMGIAALGDLAWSLGPWTYAPRKGAPPLVHGHFLSIWRRRPGGPWRVVADIGAPHAAPAAPIEGFGPVAATPAGRALPVAADPLPALRKQEAALAEAWTVQGGAALIPDLAKGARLLRRGSLPLQDAAAIRRALEAEAPGPAWAPAWVEASAGGDLAWSCGEMLPAQAGGKGPGASFLRVWTLEEGRWKVLFDVRVPHPPAAN